MATIQDAPNLTNGDLTLYYANDEYFSTVLVFHGPVTISAVSSSSRIQLVIFTIAGFQKYPRITLSPTSPLYAAVNHLPREKQGDEVCRGLAVGVLKYFAELSEPIKQCLTDRAKKIRGVSRIPRMFDEMHAAEIANKMEKVDNAPQIAACLQAAYMEKKVPWLDIDLILPEGSIQPASLGETVDNEAKSVDSQISQFGAYAPIVQLFGEPVFLPTSKLRRAPSQPTNVSKSRHFSPQQKEALRLAMCEVVDTEERYVSKIYELVHSVVDDFRAKAKAKSTTSASPSESMLTELFPPCLDQILKVNMEFLNAIRDVLESSEQEAMEDIEKGADTPSDLKRRRDPQGATTFAKVLVEWFPRFSDPYRDYMQAHGGFSDTLSLFLKDQNSSFSRRIYETGEQKIRSMLMEPVQRLPRYSLLIDAMTSTLPSSHAALRPLLKARDMITDICSLDSDDDDQEQTVKRLQNKISMWPSAVRPAGRLITAIDVAELTAGYIPPHSAVGSCQAILLLFPEMLVLLKKDYGCSLSARGLLAELEKRSQSFKALEADGARLSFSEALSLSCIEMSQSACGNILYMNQSTSPVSGNRSMPRHLMRSFQLLSADQGKASRFLEETIKARIEGRFSEKERESGKWTLLAQQSSPSSLNLMTAICEGGEFAGSRRGNASTVFQLGEADTVSSQSFNNSQIMITATMSSGGRYRVEISHACGKSTDIVSLEDLRTVLLKRLSTHIKSLNSFQNAALASAIIEANEAVHRTLEFRSPSQAKNPRGFRPPSPTKFLANWWSGGREPISKSDTIGSLSKGPIFPPPQPLASRIEQTDHSQDDHDTKIKPVAAVESNAAKDSLHQLEQTFTAYILALRSRRGNIVGRSLRGRSDADPVAVNDLYNVLLDDASKIQAAAEVSVDVLIAAFEKFLAHGWKDRIGPIITLERLKHVQKKFERQFPADFESFFKSFLNDLAPQNKRAFTALVRLLTDLLDASGNDGDRGALTATFAELLAGSDARLDYISLLDRLVEDYERLFDDSVPIGWPTEKEIIRDTGGSNNLSSQAKNGSISSQTSSFRKRFGFGLSRNNSNKDDSESKVSSIIRSLSKSKEPNSQPSSLSKGSLARSKSTDSDSRITALLRPVSRDRLAFTNITNDEHGFGSRPGSAHSTVQLLQAIGEVSMHSEEGLGKKKRRSSLSDLKSLQVAMGKTQISSSGIKKPLATPAEQILATEDKGVQRTPNPTPNLRSPPLNTSPTKITFPPSLSPPKPISKIAPPTTVPRLGSVRTTSPTLTRSLPKKENIKSPTPSSRPGSPLKSPPVTSPRATRTHLGERNLNRLNSEVTNPALSPKKRTEVPSSIPTPKNGTQRDRPSITSTASGSPVKKAPVTSPPTKMKVSSPSKIRERLSREKQALSTQTSSLNSELAKIGEELDGLALSPTKQPLALGSPSRPKSSSASTNPAKNPAVIALQSRLAVMETSISTLEASVRKQTSNLESDILGRLEASEKKVKNLDVLFQETSKENEALYDRFNSELEKISRAVNTDNTVEIRQMSEEMSLEIKAYKKANLALKRELALLKVSEREGTGRK